MFSEQKIQHRRVLSHARCPFSLDTLARPSEAPLYWVRPDLVGENRADRVGVSLCSVPLVDYGVIEWTKNEFYCLSRLIGSIDHFIKEDAFAAGSFDSRTGYGLVVTNTAAYVFSYLHSGPDNHPVTLTFPLPQDMAKDRFLNKDVLPLGALVAPCAGSDEPGLVIVMPISGRIAYWESIGGAIAEGLIHKKSIEGRIPLVSGEMCVCLCNAEPANFVLATSSGKLLHLSLVDSSARLHIGLLNMTSSSGICGLFSSFTGALWSATTRRDICSINAGELKGRGARDVIVCTKRGTVSKWEVTRNGYAKLILEKNLWNSMVEILVSTLDISFSMVEKSLLIYDIMPIPNSTSLVLILASFLVSLDSPNYVLFISDLESTALKVTSVHLLQYHGLHSDLLFHPRILIPKPGDMTIIVFSDALYLILTPTEETFDSEILFEDIITFNRENRVQILAAGYEDSLIDPSSKKIIRNPSVLVATKNAGILRCETFKITRPHKDLISRKNRRKLDQAVFYGFLDGNPINFSWTSEYDIENIQAVAINLSHDILTSASKYHSSSFIPLENDLFLKSLNLSRLSKYLLLNFDSISSETRWKLCWDAEKCESAQNLWSKINTRLTKVEDNIITDIIKGLATKETGKNVIRWWFQKGLQNIACIVSKAYKCCVDVISLVEKDGLRVLKTIAEANEIILAILVSAQKFRKKRAEFLKLNEPLYSNDNSLLPWTSSSDILSVLSNHYNLTNAIMLEFKRDNLPLEDKVQNTLNSVESMKISLKETLVTQLIDLAELICCSFEERILWTKSIQMNSLDNEKKNIEEKYLSSRGNWIKFLAEIDKLDKSFEIAEKYRDFRTLVELCYEIGDKNMDYNWNDQVTRRINWYLYTFKEEFADVLYRYFMEKGHLFNLLEDFSDYHHYLSRFFKSGNYGRISWMHEIGTDRFKDAGNTLYNISQNDENFVFNKRVELSISKLCFLEYLKSHNTEKINGLPLINIEYHLEALQIQSSLLDEIRSFIENAIDINAAVDLVVEKIGQSLKKRPATKIVFKRALKNLILEKILDPEDLIDLLTLKDKKTTSYEISANEYYLALKVLNSSQLPLIRHQSVEKTIWRPDTSVEADTKYTALYETINLCVISKFFENSNIYPISPKNAYFDPKLDDLCSRFSKNTHDSEISVFSTELLKENQLLDKYEAKANLDSWFIAIMEALKLEIPEDNQKAC
ncbi:hypothetical protein MERGE_003160 [Pneumocystis wakefieldiae]|uniref:Nucleoporin Nup133/Nup155-like N-terminal domain-containing protein n=1 Tax=Pneumocystis wakefieldiae TaxID=38082 RepID=A0A899FZM6_9ASCO|nr:hypothetical protein MERGE_003160 [Pneumocystis wakefieldiae]